MQPDLNDLTIMQLVDLQTKLINRLDELQKAQQDILNRKYNVKNKTKLFQLTDKDVMFGIGLGSNGDHLIKEIGTKWSVYFLDYCDVHGCSKRKDKGYNISVGHKTQPFGVSTWISDDVAEKHYFLSLDEHSNGYELFFTLKPETWKEDIQEALLDLIKNKKHYFKRDINILKKKVKIILDDENKINSQIKIFQENYKKEM